MYIFQCLSSSCSVSERVVEDSVIINEEHQYTNDSLNDENVEHDIFMVSMSTCAPCMKAKKLLDSYGVSYDYVDIDTASQEKWEYAIDKLDDFISGRGISMVYPMLIVKGHKMIQGYDEKSLHAIARELVIEEK